VATNGNSRFIYNASAVAVGANFGSGHPLTRSWAACSLPHIGGSAEADGGSFNNGVLTFGSAKTKLTGEKIGSKYQTTALTTVTGLNILNRRITANKVEVELTFTFTENPQKLDDVNVSVVYDGLTIDGGDFPQALMDEALAKKAGKDHGNLDKHLKDAKKEKHHHKTKNGKTFTSLAKEKDLGGDERLRYEPEDHSKEYAFVDVADLGRVYFAEWVEAEAWQSITGLRIKLTGDPKGEIVIADPIGNGQFFP